MCFECMLHVYMYVFGLFVCVCVCVCACVRVRAVCVRACVCLYQLYNIYISTDNGNFIFLIVFSLVTIIM